MSALMGILFQMAMNAFPAEFGDLCGGLLMGRDGFWSRDDPLVHGDAVLMLL